MSVYSTEAVVELVDEIETSSGMKKVVSTNLYVQRPVGTDWYMFEIQGHIRFSVGEYASIIISENAFWTIVLSLLGIKVPDELKQNVRVIRIDKKGYYSPDLTKVLCGKR